MRYLALACDYDGTIATHGKVDEATLKALERLLASGRKLILVTGREMPDLHATFSRLDLFELVVAENGALLYWPATRQEKPLAEPPPSRFVQELQSRGVQNISTGRVIVATWEPHEKTVLSVIHDQGLELQVIFNKGAVMVLPSGVNKATGLKAGLKELGLSAHNVVAVGDAENDHAFLSYCECSAAVANALATVKETADVVTPADHGAGVSQLIDHLLADDLRSVEARLRRHHVLLGTREDGAEVKLAPYGSSVLVAGPSGSGKSTVTTGFLERLGAKKYQYCVIDPEGDYEELAGAVVLGNGQRAPTADEVLHLLTGSYENAVVNLIGMPLTERPTFFLSLLPRLQELRARTGRPHWLVVDETHHLLPASWEPGAQVLPPELDRLLLITVHPDQVAPAIMTAVNTVLAVGNPAAETFTRFCKVVGGCPPDVRRAPELEPGEVLLWRRGSAEPPVRVKVTPGKTERKRHIRKYAEGELPPDRSFYFRGAAGKLKLRAQNLILFLQLADGIDDETWMYHLRQGDYSRWFRTCIKDEVLAAESARVEKLAGVTPEESRRLIRAVVEEHYTLPTAPTLPMPGTAAAKKV